jgi:hypothetical protein
MQIDVWGIWSFAWKREKLTPTRVNAKTPSGALFAAPTKGARLDYERWRAFNLAPIVRPKGMWRRRFRRLQDAIDEADLMANAASTMRLRALNDRMRNRGRKMQAQSSAVEE